MTQTISETQCDLAAFRCPDATVHMRNCLTAFAESHFQRLTLSSIEPSLRRSMEALITMHLSQLTLTLVTSRPITDADRSAWADRFDECDHEDCTHIHTFVLTK